MSNTPPHRLLIRGVNWLGDAVMTTPALARLREALPSAHIALLTRIKLADLWSSHPAIDEVLTIEPGESVWTVGAKLRPRGFDTALILPNSPRSAIEVWWGRIPRRIGYSHPWRNAFLTEPIPPRPGHVKMRKRSVGEIRRLIRDTHPGANRDQEERSHHAVPEQTHQLYEYLHLVATLGASGKPLPPTLVVGPRDLDDTLRKFKIPGDGVWLGLNAGAEYGPAKRWPMERFIAAARDLQHRTGCGCLVFGGPGDRALAEDITAQLRGPGSRIHNLAGRTSLRELMALLKHCRVLLTNDTGPMHMAAALGVPVVVPFGSTSAGLTGPGLPGDTRHRLIQSHAPCSPCFLRECPIDFRCMKEVGVDFIVEAVAGILTAG